MACGRSRIATPQPPAAVGSSGDRSFVTIAPGQPPMPSKIATYYFPSGPRYVTGWPMIPEPVRNCQSSAPVRACTALNQRSMVP